MSENRLTTFAIFAAVSSLHAMLQRMRREDRERFAASQSRLAMMLGEFQMITQEVRDLMDQAKAATALAPAVDAGMKALSGQIADLTAKVNASQSMSPDEKASIVAATTDLKTSVDTLQKDIPANVQPAPAPTVDPNQPQPQPQTDPNAPQPGTGPIAPNTGTLGGR